MQRNPAELMLCKAEADLRALRGMRDIMVFDDSIFGFHAQQAVEKVLKAWLELLDVFSLLLFSYAMTRLRLMCSVLNVQRQFQKWSRCCSLLRQ